MISLCDIRVIKDNLFRLFNNILTSISRDWRNCDSIAYNMCIMTNKANLSHCCSMLIISIYAMAVIVYISVIIEFNNINTNVESVEKELFLKMQFPFAYEFFPVYEIVMFVQFVQLLSNASVIGMLDALIITLVSSFRFLILMNTLSFF